MIELVDDRDLPRWHLKDRKRIRGGKHAGHPIRHAVSARDIDDRAVLQAGDVLFIGLLAGRGERQLAAADDLDLGPVFRRPVCSGNIWRLAVGQTG